MKSAEEIVWSSITVAKMALLVLALLKTIITLADWNPELQEVAREASEDILWAMEGS